MSEDHLFSDLERELFSALVAIVNNPRQDPRERSKALAQIREEACELIPPNYIPDWEEPQDVVLNPNLPKYCNLMRPELAEQFYRASVRLDKYKEGSDLKTE